MILQSVKDMDTQFVSRCIQEHNLDATPLTGFNADPNYWIETARWRRIVEKYGWGAVIFMADRARDRAATVIAIGKVDLDKGRVTTQGGQRPISVGWYQEMVMELQSATKVAQLEIPSCLGFRKPDHICDGGLNRETRKLEPACAWRDRCIALQEYAHSINRPQEAVLQNKSPAQIVQITTRLLERKGVPVEHRPAEPEPVKTVKPIVRKAAPPASLAATAAKDSSALREELVKNVSTVTRTIAETAGLKVAADETRKTALAGELFLVNRVSSSGYISLYQAATGAGEEERALAAFRIRARKGGYNVQLALPKESPLYEGVVESDVKPFKDGKFLSIISGCPPTGLRMDHVKRIIVAMLAA